MRTLSNADFARQIAQWKRVIVQAGITLPQGEALPDKFFHVFLGVGYSTFKKMLKGRDIQPYTIKTIGFVNQLPPAVFLDAVRGTIPEYMALTKKTIDALLIDQAGEK
jgi:hypothetical protein